MLGLLQPCPRGAGPQQSSHKGPQGTAYGSFQVSDGESMASLEGHRIRDESSPLACRQGRWGQPHPAEGRAHSCLASDSSHPGPRGARTVSWMLEGDSPLLEKLTARTVVTSTQAGSSLRRRGGLRPHRRCGEPQTDLWSRRLRMEGLALSSVPLPPSLRPSGPDPGFIYHGLEASLCSRQQHRQMRTRG